MISTASSPRFLFGHFYNILTRGNDIGGLNIIWIAGGFVLLAMGIFGIWSALKESAFMMNLYTVVLSFALILQIVTATTSNTLSGELDYFVSHSIQDLMVQYGHNSEFTSVMDSIQKEYQCCGYKGSSDWNAFDKTTTTTKKPSRTFTELEYYDDEFKESILAIQDDYMIMQQDVLDESLFKKNPLPASCCKTKKCKNYNSRGCFKPLYNDIARVVYMVKSVAMISSVLQIFGVLAAYIFGKNLKD